MELPIFSLLIYLQPLAWFWLYDKPIHIDLRLLWWAGITTIVMLIESGWSYAHYTNPLLITYVVMVMFVAWVFRFRPGFQPISLAFLIVFLNSIFWEFPIHVADFLEFDNFGTLALQCVHLLPVPFLLSAGMVLRRRWWYTSCWSWFIILGFTYLRMEGMIPYPTNVISLYLSRFLGLATLLFILRFPEQGESKAYLKVREFLAPVFRCISFS